ncbi:MAG: hypothetical protein INR62_07005, partial [Rhodospirillales bacterium]|nr:hypothetical protein [Acetobacter sp.]
MRSLVFLGFLTGCLSVLLGQELRVGVLPSAAVDEGLVLRGEPLTLVITSAIPDEAGLARAVAELYDPSSPRYRHWMTDEELARFAPSPVSVRRVQGALERQGLRVVDRDANGFSLVVQGPVEAAERAFAVSVHQFSRGPERFREAV